MLTYYIKYLTVRITGNIFSALYCLFNSFHYKHVCNIKKCIYNKMKLEINAIKCSIHLENSKLSTYMLILMMKSCFKFVKILC